MFHLIFLLNPKYQTMKLKFIAILSIGLFAISCGGDDEPRNTNPGDFTVSIVDITSSTATITYTESVDPDGDDVTYDIELDARIIFEDLNANTQATVNNLQANTTYDGSVTAKDDKGGTNVETFSFTTTSP